MSEHAPLILQPQGSGTSWKTLDLYPKLSSILILYNKPSYSRILIGSRLCSIRGQTHDLRHHHKVFPSAF